MYMFTYKCAYIHTHIHICANTHTQTTHQLQGVRHESNLLGSAHDRPRSLEKAYTHMYIFIYTRKYANTHTRIDIRANTYTHTTNPFQGRVQLTNIQQTSSQEESS